MPCPSLKPFLRHPRASDKPDHKKSWRRAGVAAVLAAVALGSLAAMTTSPDANQPAMALVTDGDGPSAADVLARRPMPEGMSPECWLVEDIGCPMVGDGITSVATCDGIEVGIDAAVFFFGGGPGDPIADTIVAAFDFAFSAACLAAVTAGGVFTEELCDEAIEKKLGLSC